jgi:UDPglucose 6-dehydrogenase
MTKIAIIGSGVVGTATGKGLHKLGHRIIFNDISSQRLLALEKEGYKVTTSIKEAISKTNISFICVNTPVCVKKK